MTCTANTVWCPRRRRTWLTAQRRPEAGWSAWGPPPAAPLRAGPERTDAWRQRLAGQISLFILDTPSGWWTPLSPISTCRSPPSSCWCPPWRDGSMSWRPTRRRCGRNIASFLLVMRCLFREEGAQDFRWNIIIWGIFWKNTTMTAVRGF